MNSSGPVSLPCTDKTTEPAPPRLLRLALVEERTSLKKSSIYDRIRSGTFPAPVSLGGQAVAWVEAQVNQWIESRPPVATGRPRKDLDAA